VAHAVDPARLPRTPATGVNYPLGHKLNAGIPSWRSGDLCKKAPSSLLERTFHTIAIGLRDSSRASCSVFRRAVRSPRAPTFEICNWQPG
jgi:hypothetical protein